MAVMTAKKVELLLKFLNDYNEGTKDIVKPFKDIDAIAYGEGQIDAITMVIAQVERVFAEELSQFAPKGVYRVRVRAYANTQIIQETSRTRQQRFDKIDFMCYSGSIQVCKQQARKEKMAYTSLSEAQNAIANLVPFKGNSIRGERSGNVYYVWSYNTIIATYAIPTQSKWFTDQFHSVTTSRHLNIAKCGLMMVNEM